MDINNLMTTLGDCYYYAVFNVPCVNHNAHRSLLAVLITELKMHIKTFIGIVERAAKDTGQYDKNAEISYSVS